MFKMYAAAFAVAGAILWPSAASAATSVTDRLTLDHTGIEVTSEPQGTTRLHIAVMQNLAGAGIKYLDIPAGQLTYVPPASTPVVDVTAFGVSGQIGGWAGRLQTTPAGSPEEPPPSSEAVGLDIGGWAWESAVRDESGATKAFRSSYTSWNSSGQAALLQKFGAKLYPLFSGGGSIAGINPSSFASVVVSWFKAYGAAAKADTAEILNEPGNPYFWSDPSNYGGYVRLVRTVKHALVANGLGNVKVLISWDGGYGGDSYGRSLQAAGLLSSDYDGVTVHPYGGHSSVTTSALGNRARVTEAHSNQPDPVYVTEVGWPTCGATGDSLNWTQQQQAENITRWVSWTKSLGYVALTVNFNYADYSGNCYGIVGASGSPHKLSYAALQTAAR